MYVNHSNAGVLSSPQLKELDAAFEASNPVEVLLAQSSGQEVEYREAFGRFERHLWASARNSERA